MRNSTIAPGFLVAMPQLRDPNFHRTVVLMLEHNEQGSFGLVVNRVSSMTMEEFAASQEIAFNGDPDQRVYIGGPVGREAGWILHRASTVIAESHPVTSDLHLTRSLAALKDVCERGERGYRLFMGYAGWGPGQLESEMNQGAWVTADLDLDLVFQGEGDLWDVVLRRMGINPIALVPGGSEIN